MSEISFEERLARLKPASAIERPKIVYKAKNRRERLQLALAYLERGGIAGRDAYPPMFRGLARSGIILKPLHFWSVSALVLFAMCFLTVIGAFLVGAAIVMESAPRPVRAMIEAGPMVFFSGSFVMSLIYAGVIRIKGMQASLPRWRDL